MQNSDAIGEWDWHPSLRLDGWSPLDPSTRCGSRVVPRESERVAVADSDRRRSWWWQRQPVPYKTECDAMTGELGG